MVFTSKNEGGMIAAARKRNIRAIETILPVYSSSIRPGRPAPAVLCGTPIIMRRLKSADGVAKIITHFSGRTRSLSLGGPAPIFRVGARSCSGFVHIITICLTDYVRAPLFYQSAAVPQ